MTIDIAFKTPDALVFATDGLATVMEVDARGQERFLSNMANVEKLVPLSGGQLLAMFNGVGSIGGGTVATSLRAFDDHSPLRPGESVGDYARRLHAAMEEQALRRLGALPRPFHLILGGFAPPPKEGVDPPTLWSIQWSVDPNIPTTPTPVLHTEEEGGPVRHAFGVHYAGVTEAVARFVEGFDPALPERLAVLLAGTDEPEGPPGLLEQLAQEARRTGTRAESLSNEDARQLARRYARRVLRSAFFSSAQEPLSEHFSLQAAVDYCVFLAQCAYARENLSPTRRGAPRVGSTLQVAYLVPGRPAHLLAGIRLGVRLQGIDGGLP
ncbi:hypothetical protein [Hyalangium gracile]|uniref:hypothetical protein n=1 Tax=Hyalangium gracile TaxID=394092 RepID=UPI001CCBA9CE|nr:hypothetical protein [Hyalangium gracile]